MASNELTTRIVLANHTSTEWANISTVPLVGELCLETDTRKAKIGNGTDAYSALSYLADADTNYVYTLAAGSETTAVDKVTLKVPLTGSNGGSSSTSTITVNAATTARAGVMTKDQATKLAGISTSANKVVIAESTENGKIKVTTDGSAANVVIHGLAAAAYKTTATTISASGTALPTEKAVADYVTSAIDALPEPMLFKGSVGTGGTTASLPTTGLTAYEGWTYKVVTAGTYGGVASKVGDTLICNGTEWVLIPSGDEPSGTVTSVGLGTTGNSPFTITNSPITSSGTINIELNNSGVTAGTYGSTAAQTPGYNTTFAVPYVTVDAKGRVTAASTASVKIPAADNTNYYTTAMSGSTAADGYTVGVTGNNTAVKGSVKIPKMVGATSGAPSVPGLVPQATTAQRAMFLKADGTWATPTDTNTNYYTTALNKTTAADKITLTVAGNNSAVKGTVEIPAASASVAGVMTTAQASKLAGIEAEANKYVHPNDGTAGTYGSTAAQTPGYGSTFNVPWVTVNALGHVITAGVQTVKIPASDNTNYYTTASNRSTAATSFTVNFNRSDGTNKYSFTIPEATETMAGVSSTVSTDRLRNGANTLVLNGNFS